MDLKKLNLVELNSKETVIINGGEVAAIPWGKIYKWAEKAGVFVAIADAADRFVEGWNSVSCGCK